MVDETSEDLYKNIHEILANRNLEREQEEFLGHLLNVTSGRTDREDLTKRIMLPCSYYGRLHDLTTGELLSGENNSYERCLLKESMIFVCPFKDLRSKARCKYQGNKTKYS